MSRKTFFSIIITFFFTTIFWCLVLKMAGYKIITAEEADNLPNNLVSSNEEAMLHRHKEIIEQIEDERTYVDELLEQADESDPIPDELIGSWLPVETTTLTMELTKYGKAIVQERDINYRFEYGITIRGSRLNIGGFRCDYKILHHSGKTYLEIYGDAKFAGKYVKN